MHGHYVCSGALADSCILFAGCSSVGGRVCIPARQTFLAPYNPLPPHPHPPPRPIPHPSGHCSCLFFSRLRVGELRRHGINTGPISGDSPPPPPYATRPPPPAQVENHVQARQEQTLGHSLWIRRLSSEVVERHNKRGFEIFDCHVKEISCAEYKLSRLSTNFITWPGNRSLRSISACGNV